MPRDIFRVSHYRVAATKKETWHRLFEVPAHTRSISFRNFRQKSGTRIELRKVGTSTADLKSLYHEPRVVFQGLQIDKAVLDSTNLLVPMTFSKFVKVGAAIKHELRKSGH